MTENTLNYRGGIVYTAHGWKPGKPVYSAEGCWYPTWVRVPEAKKAKRTKKVKRKRKN